MRETTRGFELFELGPLLKRRDLICLFSEVLRKFLVIFQ